MRCRNVCAWGVDFLSRNANFAGKCETHPFSPLQWHTVLFPDKPEQRGFEEKGAVSPCERHRNFAMKSRRWPFVGVQEIKIMCKPYVYPWGNLVLKKKARSRFETSQKFRNWPCVGYKKSRQCASQMPIFGASLCSDDIYKCWFKQYRWEGRIDTSITNDFSIHLPQRDGKMIDALDQQTKIFPSKCTERAMNLALIAFCDASRDSISWPPSMNRFQLLTLPCINITKVRAKQRNQHVLQWKCYHEQLWEDRSELRSDVYPANTRLYNTSRDNLADHANEKNTMRRSP